MRCHCVPFGLFRFLLGNKQMPVVGIDFFQLASTQYNSSFMNKILVPSPVFCRNDNTMMKVKLCKVYANDKFQQGDEICSRYNKVG